MGANYLEVACEHFKQLGVSPVIHEKPYPSIVFSLAEGLEAELIVLESATDEVSFSLLSSIDMPDLPSLNSLVLALAPWVTPATIQNIKGQMALEIRLQCSEKSIGSLLDEGVVLMRHFAGVVFTAAIKLTRDSSKLASILEASLKQLQSGRKIS